MPLIYLIALVATIWVIYNVWQDNTKTNEMKLIWTIGAVFFSIVTAIVYFFLEKKGKF